MKLFLDNCKSPLVSVYCMTYNQEKTIRQTIESILCQETMFPFELIIHDDASIDSTAEIVKQYAEKYPDTIHAICQEKNQFKSCNLIHTYLHPVSKGKYIAICEGDDYWTDPRKLQTQVDLMESDSSIMLCFHAVDQLTPNGCITPIHPWKGDAQIPTEQVIRRGGMFCPTVSSMFRRDVMDAWPEFRLQADVYDYPAQILAATMGRVCYIDRVMAAYRFATEGSWTARHADWTDVTHLENEEHWLELFNQYSHYQYRQAVDYSLARVWFVEYRKNPSALTWTRASQYVHRLKGKDRMVLTVLLLMFRCMGKQAEPVFCLLKKIFY